MLYVKNSPKVYRTTFQKSVAVIKPNSDCVDGKYLFYCLMANVGGLKRAAVGSAQPNLLLLDLRSFKLEVFKERSYQSKIASVLSSLDSKIELNNKINAELEAMAKLIYDYWFVQFDFPISAEQAAAMGKPELAGKPYKSSGGPMVYNQALKREIPEGWEVVKLIDEFQVQYGFPFSTKLFNETGEGVPVIRIRDILNNTISLYSTEDVNEKYRLKEGDLLIGMDGNFHMNYWDKEGCFLNQRSLRIRRTPNTRASQIQAYFDIEPYIKLREKSVSRTTVGHLSAKDVNALNTLIPSSSIGKETTENFEQFLKVIINNRKQNQELSSLRDWLLPMLMNGQVTIKEAEEHPEIYRESMAAEPEEGYGNKE